MSESSPHRSVVRISREEKLTRQFYDWEIRGRGWHVSDVPVELEPPFRPIVYFDETELEAIDDGHFPSFFSRLLGTDRNSCQRLEPDGGSNSKYLAQMEELDKPSVCEYYKDNFHELKIILPRERKVARPFVNQFVMSASYCTNPISFEVVGTSEEIIVQMAATPRDLPQLHGQLTAYFPEARFGRNEDSFLEFSWKNADGFSQIVDFGLSKEFMIPLDTVTNLDLDPLVSVIGSLTELENGEVGIFQILFQKARSDWGSEIMDGVRFRNGTPVFANDPEMIPNAKRKINSPLFAAVIRVAAKAIDRERVWQIVRGLSAGMAQLSTPASNELIPLSNEDYHWEYHEQALLSRLSFRCGMILNLDELVSLVHPPTQLVSSEKLVRDEETTKRAPALVRGHSVVLGVNEHRNTATDVTLSNDQRTRHLHLIGSSGSGKSTLLLSLIKQDLEQNHGVCVIDPHGDLIDSVMDNVPEGRIKDIVLFDPSDSEFPIGFNILQAKSLLEKNLLSSDLVATFRRMATSWGDVMDSVLANALLAFLESSRGGTLFELKRFLVEKEFREEFLESVTDDGVVYFWEQEFPLIAGKPQASILIRLDAFLRQGLIRNIVCQKENKLDFRRIMDNGKILLVKLSQGLIGEENAYLLGTMLVSRLYQSALSRQDSRERPYYWLYLDEFHHFITPSMERILSGTRKYNLGLILAHQEFRQMQSRSQEVASSVLSNCYTRVCFRLGDNDAERFSGGFSFFDAKALQNLGVGEAIARVERADYDFNLKTIPIAAVPKNPAAERRGKIVRFSREAYGRARLEVEQELRHTVQRPKKTEPTIGSKKAKEASGSIEERIEPAKPAETKHVTPVAFVPSAEPVFTETADTPFPGKRTGQHRYLQTLVKKMAEDKGFRVTIEKPVLGGVGKVDVALENESIRIACEISVTNEPDYELHNIQKCLAAGFRPVIVISADERHLERIRKTVQDTLTPHEIRTVEFLSPEEFHIWLDKVAIVSNPPEEMIKGYKVKTKIKPVDEAERKTRKQAISGVVFSALKRLKNRKDDK